MLVPLTGGANHSGWLVTEPGGVRYVVKTTPDLPAGLFEAEAEGLTVLRESGCVTAPRVLEVTETLLKLEALDPAPPFDDHAFWERLGRELAQLHLTVRHDRFGWHRDNWLGKVRQYNTWTDDCYEHFVQLRLVRYLTEPIVEQTLSPQDRAGIERICARLPELLPPSYPALTHGDFWHGNILSAAGRPALIDPHVSYSWPEVDVSLMFCYGGPERFFAAYHEVCPPTAADWREQLRLVHLRELLSVLAHGDDVVNVHQQIVALVRRYA
jgi:fructosamine-3-kinase